MRTQAGAMSCIDRYVGYCGTYAASHDLYDHEPALHEEVRNCARALASHITQFRRGLKPPCAELEDPRPT